MLQSVVQPDLFSMVKVSSEISTENVEKSWGCVLASKFVYVSADHMKKSGGIAVRDVLWWVTLQ